MNRLAEVRDVNGNILAEYLYDACGNPAYQEVPSHQDTSFFYRGSLIAVKKGEQKLSYLANGFEYRGETIPQEDGSTALGFQLPTVCSRHIGFSE